MSWFSKTILHPFVAAIEGLETNPVITANPEAAKAVADAKSAASTIASTTTAAANTIVADAQVAADPAIAALGSGLTTAADAYLTAALGPLGTALAPAANTIIALGEAKAHDLITALFAHARAQVAAAPAAGATAG